MSASLKQKSPADPGSSSPRFALVQKGLFPVPPPKYRQSPIGPHLGDNKKDIQSRPLSPPQSTSPVAPRLAFLPNIKPPGGPGESAEGGRILKEKEKQPTFSSNESIKIIKEKQLAFSSIESVKILKEKEGLLQSSSQKFEKPPVAPKQQNLKTDSVTDSVPGTEFQTLELSVPKTNGKLSIQVKRLKTRRRVTSEEYKTVPLKSYGLIVEEFHPPCSAEGILELGDEIILAYGESLVDRSPKYFARLLYENRQFDDVIMVVRRRLGGSQLLSSSNHALSPTQMQNLSVSGSPAKFGPSQLIIEEHSDSEELEYAAAVKTTRDDNAVNQSIPKSMSSSTDERPSSAPGVSVTAEGSENQSERAAFSMVQAAVVKSPNERTINKSMSGDAPVRYEQDPERYFGGVFNRTEAADGI